MKNIIILLIPFLMFSQSKEEKKLQKKLELEIVNKGLNLQDKFVIIADFSCCGSEYRDLAEKNWSTSFFKSNLHTGSWSKDDGYTIIKGRYEVNIDKNSMTIKDASDKFKTVAFLEWKGPTGIGILANEINKAKRRYIIKSLVESNQ